MYIVIALFFINPCNFIFGMNVSRGAFGGHLYKSKRSHLFEYFFQISPPSLSASRALRFKVAIPSSLLIG